MFLQELDVSNSFITDKGLLSICGVTVTEVSNRVVLETSMRGIVQVAARKRGFEEVEEEEQERGEVKSDVGEDDFSNYNENDNLQER